MKFLFALLASAVGLSLAEKIRFDNYKVYRLIPNDEETLNILKQWEDRDGLSDYNLWSPVTKVGGEVDVMVPPYRIEEIEHMAKTRYMNASILIENVQEVIDNEGFRPESRAGSFGWTSYHTFDEVRQKIKHSFFLTLINTVDYEWIFEY